MKPFLSALCLFALALTANADRASADWREDIGALRIGILAQGDSRRAVAQAEPFRLAVAERLGVAVEIFAARDYAALIDATASARIEYAVLSATAYALAWNRCECIEPLAIARSGDGTTAIKEVVIAGQHGPASLAALKGKRIAATRSKAFGGLDIALRQMREEGLDIAAGAATLDRKERSGLAMEALRDGEADALIGWRALDDTQEGASRGTLRKLGDTGGDSEVDGDAVADDAVDDPAYRIVWESVSIPHRVHAVRKSLPGEARTQLRDLLSTLFDDDPVAYDAVEPIYGGGFIVARPGQFEPLATLLKGPEKDGGANPDAEASDEPAVPEGEAPEAPETDPVQSSGTGSDPAGATESSQ